MTRRDWVAPACAGIAGLIAGLLLAGRFEREAPAPASLTEPTGDARSGTMGSSAVLSLDDVRRAVREELAAALDSRSGDAAVARQPAAQSPSAEQTAAASTAQATLESAIARRQWTDADADALRGQFQGLSNDQQAELLRQFSVAVNQGRLVPETDRIPF